ncbi:MAG: hydratase [Clostridia bacterium]
MIKIHPRGAYYNNGKIYLDSESIGLTPSEIKDAYKKTISYRILANHNILETTQKDAPLNIKFDAIASHDITFVGIIQTAKAIGLDSFPLPYVLTNCHNSLAAVGGTINSDDHIFGLSAAKKYGGIYVPPNQAVIHTYMREQMAAGGKMILGSDSHTRYGALGTMAIGEGGPELVKQITGKTYDITYPEIVGVKLYGKPRKGVGPQDIALSIIKAVFKDGLVKNKVMEFFGEGVAALPIEYRNGIDVMTTETTCLSSIWQTDEAVRNYYIAHGRENDYKELAPQDGAYYDLLIEVDLSAAEPVIALPFHPSNVYTLNELLADPYTVLGKCEQEGRELLKNPSFTLTNKITKDGRIKVDQAIIAGCAGGTYDNIFEAARILEGKSIGNTLSASVYCGSQPIYLDLIKKGALAALVAAGVVVKTSFCGPCFGAGDVPFNNGFSVRHTTRNFPSREGSKPSDGQIASVALMDARSIAATAANGGYLTSALGQDYNNTLPPFTYDPSVYGNRVFKGYGQSNPQEELVYGPNISDWPDILPLQDNLLLKLITVINDPVTTTDELIPSGEASSYRSNPLKLAEFTLGRKAPYYVGRAKAVKAEEDARQKGDALPNEYARAIAAAGGIKGTVSLGSAIFALKPGDGSAREQAASSQRVLGGAANIALEYATKRYRSNLINWGMLPFRYDNSRPLDEGDIIVIKTVDAVLASGKAQAYVHREGGGFTAEFTLDPLTVAEKDIIKAGCLINYERKNNQSLKQGEQK